MKIDILKTNRLNTAEKEMKRSSDGKRRNGILKITAACAASAVLAGAAFRRYVTKPVEIMPKAAEIRIADGTGERTYMLGGTYQLDYEVITDADLGTADMPETREFFGISFPVTYDVRDFSCEAAISSSDASLLEISESYVTPKKTGTGAIWVRCGSAAAVIPVTVKEYVKPESVPASAEVMAGQSVSITEGAGEYQVYDTSFISDDESVASVDGCGVVTGVGKGTTIVRCTLEDGSEGMTGIRVYQPVSRIRVSDKTVRAGRTVNADASVYPEDSDYGTGLVYSSSDTSVAAVSENGAIRGVRRGTSTVTVTSSNGVSAEFTVTVTAGNGTASYAGGTGASGSGADAASGSSASGSTWSGSGITEAEMDRIIAQGNAAIAKYDGNCNIYTFDDNVTTAGKSYSQVLGEVMTKVNTINSLGGIGRVFRIGATIIVARDYPLPDGMSCANDVIEDSKNYIIDRVPDDVEIVENGN